MIIIITNILTGVFILTSYTLGLKNGQKVKNEEKIETPTLNHIKKIAEIKQNKKAEEELEKISSIFENINNYDGTSASQKEV